MKAINVRYGASLPLTVTIDDATAESASLFVGKEGELPTITKTAPFVELVADLSLDPLETEVPLDTYKYQVNIVYEDGTIKKFPEPKSCDFSEFPDFKVAEALDETEVES